MLVGGGGLELSWRRHYPAAVLVKGMWSVLEEHYHDDASNK